MTQRVGVTSADRLAEIPLEGQLVWDRQLQQLFCGDGETAGGVLVTGANGFAPQYKAVSAANADTETIYFLPNTSGNTLRVTVSAGTGSFTKKLVLSRETRAEGAGSGDEVAAGTRFELSILFTTTSADRAVEIRENAEAGDVLDTFESDTEGTFSACAAYVYNGAAWEKVWSHIHTP